MWCSPDEKLYDASRDGNVADVKAALEAKADVNSTHGDVSEPGIAASCGACAWVGGRMVQRWLPHIHGCVHMQDKRTALHAAASGGHLEACQQLLLHGADPSLKNGVSASTAPHTCTPLPARDGWLP